MKDIEILEEKLNAAYQYFNYAEEANHIDASIRLINKYEQEISLIRKQEDDRYGLKDN